MADGVMARRSDGFASASTISCCTQKAAVSHSARSSAASSEVSPTCRSCSAAV